MTLVLDRVTVTEGGKALLDDVSLRCNQGEFIALVGPNGAGKSTVLKTALGVIRPSSGQVLLGGNPVRSLAGRERAARAAWLPQRPALEDPIQVLDFVGAGRFRFDETRSQTDAQALRFLARVGLDSFAERDLSTLSGGEQQRVALASMLAQEAPLLVLDEPAAHLDPKQQAEVHALLVALWREGRSLLCATHDLNLLTQALLPAEAARVRIAGLRGGRLAFSCACDSPDLANHLSALFDVEMRSIQIDERPFFVSRPAQRGAA